MIVTILWRMESSPVVNYLMEFDDVNPAAYYGEAVRWADREGIVVGYGTDRRFGPNDPITREQLTAMLWRYVGSPVSSSELEGFTDAANISEYAYDAVF